MAWIVSAQSNAGRENPNQVHARRLQQVSQDPQEELTYTFYRRDTYSMPVARKKEDLVNTIDVPQCSRVDSDTGTSASIPCMCELCCFCLRYCWYPAFHQLSLHH